MSRTVELYLKRVRRKLCAAAKTKAGLIDGLREEIAELGDEPGYDDLIRTFGTPGQVARELQSSIEDGKVASVRSRSRHAAIALGVVAAMLVVTLASYMWYNAVTPDYYTVSGNIETTNYFLTYEG